MTSMEKALKIYLRELKKTENRLKAFYTYLVRNKGKLTIVEGIQEKHIDTILTLINKILLNLDAEIQKIEERMREEGGR